MGNVAAVFCFEWRRALTVPRMAWWFVLTLFPVFIVTLIRLSPADIPREPWAVFLFALIPLLVSMLGTFLWTTPAVAAELERESWIYLAVRPHGKVAVLLGKYLAAVTWVLPAAFVGLTISILIAPTGDAWRIWSTMARIVLLSCPAYAAVYLVLGTLFTKRSMVVAIAYTLIFELAVSFVPAIINKLTVQYRLRALLVEWAEITIQSGQDFPTADLFGTAPAWLHVTVLVVYTLTLLAAAVTLVRNREYTVAQAADV